MKKILIPREHEFLRLIMYCKRSGKFIDFPHCSLKDFKFQLNRLYQKFGVDNLDDLYKEVTKLGWPQPKDVP